MILTHKYMDHLPLYRQKQRFARENIPIASSTIENAGISKALICRTGICILIIMQLKMRFVLLHWDVRTNLFAGSHNSAQRAAMIYSFFAICKKHEVNPYQWLKYALQNIMTTNHKNIRDLYPQNFKKLFPDDKM